MFSLLAPLLLVPALTAADPMLEPGVQLSYRGTVALLEGNGSTGPVEKKFDLTLLVSERSDDGATLYWLLDETGRGSWPWIERFGRLRLNAVWRHADGNAPALLYDLGESTSIIEIAPPLLTAKAPLAAGASWRDDPLAFEVQRSGEINGRQAWRIGVSNAYGRQRQVWLTDDSPVAVAVTQRVFMDMGTEYQLSMDLAAVQQLSAERAAAEIEHFDALLDLRAQLNRPARSEAVDWTQPQLALLSEKLPALVETISAGPLEKIVRAAARDVELQVGRADDVAQLTARQQGRQVDAFQAEGTGREMLSDADLKGQVTLLHFWEYRDEPLQEPYGQVGYLDFLYEQHKRQGLRLYGVAVDGRLADEGQRGAALRGIRKLKSFMNLSYPVLLDSGPLIRQFGDPRLVGATLPLFVVIGPDGRVLHYHVGHYEVDRERGLEELDRLIADALRERS